MKQSIERIISIGTKSSYLPWENYLVRKLNTMTLIAIFNIFVAISLYSYLSYTDLILDCILGLCTFPLVFLLNKYKNYIWTSYWFFFWGFLLFVSINFKMGKDSMMLLFYFPMITTMVQLFSRREMLKHLIFIIILCLASIFVILFEFYINDTTSSIGTDQINNLAFINITLAITATIAFTLTITFETIKQENEIKRMLHEKVILLAEVFHRVKNNMNIVTSLLNLKKNMSESLEVQEALEDCRSRVFSMALVHNIIFNSNNLIGLNFKNYIQLLVNEISNSHGNSENITITVESEEINIDMASAIPCGLILNELITNAFKYAQIDNQKLLIHINFFRHNDLIKLIVQDNGPGIKDLDQSFSNSLGLDLIKSLADQINGTYSFHNDNGLVFQLEFIQ